MKGFNFFKAYGSIRLFAEPTHHERKEKPFVLSSIVDAYRRMFKQLIKFRTMSSGFSLIELLIATFIASILGALLFAALYQFNKFVPRIDTTTGIYEKAALVNAQLERDLSGATAPHEYYYRLPEPSAAAKAMADKAKKEKEAALRQAQDEKEKAESEKKPKKPLEKIFYSVNKDGMLNQLSFLTTNPLQVYWSVKAGSAKPRIARVLYTLKEEKGSPKSYNLIRQESSNLEYDAITKTGKESPQEFVLADGIKSLAVEYTYNVPEKKEKGGVYPEPGQGVGREAKTEAPKKREIKKSLEWIKKETQGEQRVGTEEKASTMPLVPQLAELKISFWDNKKKRSIPFSLKIRIRSDILEKREEEDISQKLLGTLREFFTTSFAPTPQPPARITQTRQPTLIRGPLHR